MKSALFWDITQRCCRPHRSVGEHELHSRNTTCGGGQRGYKCRSIDTDYQSNCITVTVCINTYLFATRALSTQNPSQLCTTLNIVVATSSLTFLLSCLSTASYVGLSPSICRTQLGLASVPLAPPVKQVSFFVLWPKLQIMFSVGIRVTKTATRPQLG